MDLRTSLTAPYGTLAGVGCSYRGESSTLEHVSVEPPRYRVLSHKTIVMWAVAIIATGVGLAVWLLIAYGHEDPLGAIRTAGTVVVGSGGGAALLLAARRQRSAEIAPGAKGARPS
jgi:hypothetical protein